MRRSASLSAKFRVSATRPALEQALAVELGKARVEWIELMLMIDPPLAGNSGSEPCVSRERRAQSYRLETIPVIGADFREGLVQFDPGIVDQHVEPSGALSERLDRTHDLRRFPQVSLQEAVCPARVARGQFGCGGFSGLTIGIEDADLSTRLLKALGNGPPYPLGAPCHQGNFALKRICVRHGRMRFHSSPGNF